MSIETKPPISPLDHSLLVRANEGRTLHAFGEEFVVLLDGKQTGQKFTAFLSISPPGGGPGPHYHEREDEWFYVVEGRVSFLINGTWTDLSPGDCVYSLAVRSTLLKIIRISLSACSSIPLPQELKDSSPKQPRSGRNRSATWAALWLLRRNTDIIISHRCFHEL